MKSDQHEINVDKIMDNIRKEVLRKRKTIKIDRLQLEIRNHVYHEDQLHEDDYHLNHFLMCNDDAFIRKAFATIYHRPPSHLEIEKLLKRMNKGMTRTYILGRMRYSFDGRRVGAKIDGLVPSFIIHSLYRIPLMGYFLKLFISLIKLPHLMHQARKNEMEMYGYTEAMESYLNCTIQNIQDQINNALGQIEIALNQILNDIQSQKETSNNIADTSGKKSPPKHTA